MTLHANLNASAHQISIGLRQSRQRYQRFVAEFEL
jgi:hypothetical protein